MKKLLTLAFLLSFSFAFSQEVYRDALVILNSGDTIFGQVKYFGTSKNTEKCVFKELDSDHVTTYNPREIFGYKFLEGSYFVSKTFIVEGEEINQFAEFMVDGITDLYRIYNQEKLHYVLVKDDSLSIYLDASQSDEQSQKNVSEEYSRLKMNKGKLKYFMQDFQPIYPKIENMDYSEKTMVNLVKDYHNGTCDEYACINYSKNKIRAQKYFGLTLGLNISSLSFSGSNAFDHLTRSATQQNQSILFGINFGTNIPDVNERIYIDFQASKYSEEWRFDKNGGVDIDRIEEIQDDTSPTDEEKTSTLMNYQLTQMDIAVSYLVYSSRLRFRPKLGIGLGKLHSTGYEFYDNYVSPRDGRALFNYNTELYFTANFGLMLEYLVFSKIYLQVETEFSTLPQITTYGGLDGKYRHTKHMIRLVKYFK